MSLWRRILLERRSVILPLAVLLAANVVVLAAVVLPLQRSVSGSTSSRYDATVRLAAARRDLADAEQATNRKRQTDEDLKRFYDQILSSSYPQARNAVSVWPSRTASSLGLQYTAAEVTPPTEIRDSQLMRVTARFTLRGEYQNIRKFLYAVEAAEEFLVVERIKLAQPGAQQQNSSVLEFEVTITTFYPGGQK